MEPKNSMEAYDALIARMQAQLRHEAPEIAARTFLYDHRQGIAQIDAMLDTIPGLSAETRTELRGDLMGGYSTVMDGTASGITISHSINGQDYSFITLMPPLARSLTQHETTLAHELTHVLERQGLIDMHAHGDDVVSMEWRATLAEYAYSILNNPTPEGVAQVEQANERRLSNMLRNHGPEANYAYYVLPEALQATIEAALAQAGADRPFTTAQQIALAAVTAHRPSEQQIDQDIAELVALDAQHSPAYNSRAEEHAALATATGAWAPRIHAAQEAREGWAQGDDTQRALGTWVMRDKDAASVSLQLASGVEASLTRSASDGSVLLAVDADDNPDTGYMGFEAIYRVTAQGEVRRENGFEREDSHVIGQTAQASPLLQAGAATSNEGLRLLGDVDMQAVRAAAEQFFSTASRMDAEHSAEAPSSARAPSAPNQNVR